MFDKVIPIIFYPDTHTNFFTGCFSGHFGLRLTLARFSPHFLLTLLRGFWGQVQAPRTRYRAIYKTLCNITTFPPTQHEKVFIVRNV